MQVFFQDDLSRYSASAMKYQIVYKAVHCHGDQQSLENTYLVNQQTAKNCQQHGVLPVMRYMP